MKNSNQKYSKEDIAKRRAWRKSLLDDDSTDASFKIEAAKPQPPEGWKEQGK